MELSKGVATLNDVRQTLRDGEEGFRAAAGSLTDAHLKRVFEQYAAQRGEMAHELEVEIGKLGGTAGTSGSVAGSLHRGWMKLKGSVNGLDDHAILAEAERGEDMTKEAYAKALKTDLPAGARRLLEDQAEIVRLAHEEVRALRDRR
jgi:uncharacterized protein (TIGR02284 family)